MEWKFFKNIAKHKYNVCYYSLGKFEDMRELFFSIIKCKITCIDPKPAMVAPFAVCKNPENQILAHDENLRTTYSVITFVSTTYGFLMKRILLENAFEISSEKCLYTPLFIFLNAQC